MFGEELAFANRAFLAGNLAASEIVCRNILDADPRNAAALNFLGVLAVRLKATEQARAYFADAIRAEPRSQTLRNNLDSLKLVASSRAQAETPRYLVIKAWGFGFWSDISHVLGSLLLAEITGRTPVIHLGCNSLYSDGSDADVFQAYFQPVSDVSLRDLAGMEGTTFFPAKWNRSNLENEDVAKWEGAGSRAGALYFLNRPETIAVSDFYVGVVYVRPWIPAAHPMHGKSLEEIHRYLMEKYLRPNAQCQAACDEFFSRHLQGAPFAGVHMRGTDKILEDEDVYARHEACLASLAAVDPAWRIFLLTDDAPMAARMKALYGDRVVLTDAQRSSTTLGIHCHPAIDRWKAGLEVVTDTFLGARAERFIGTGRSNVSTLIAAMKNWAPEHCGIFGVNQLTERNLYIFTT
jgi:hypothetical protein